MSAATRHLPTRLARSVATASTSSGRPDATAPAAWKVKAFAKTDSCRNSRCSDAVSRPWLQSSVARRVWWRGSAVRRPPIRPLRRDPSVVLRPFRPSRSTLAAAIEIASGRPSSRWHSAQTSGTSASPSVKSSRLADARSAKSCTAGKARAWPGVRSRHSSGVSSEASRCTHSPGMRIGSRLVISRCVCGAAAITRSTISATSAITCSQLSSTTSACLSRR